MGFFVLGISHKECPVGIRERLHFTARKMEEALLLSRDQAAFSEFVILSTCNRVEFYGYTEFPEFPEDALFELIERVHETGRAVFQDYLYRREGKQAINHLFHVAAGLDSLVIGENEILGQLREAFRAANEARTVHSFLYRLMEKALKVGKDVRSRTRINEGAVSIPSVAVELAEKIFGKLAGQNMMVFGTGEMSSLTLKNLKQAGAEALCVVSRSQERGERLAHEFGGEWVGLESWEKHLARVDILIASTASPHPIIHVQQIRQAMQARKFRPLFLIDIAVPRDIEPEADQIDNVYLYNIDDLKGVAAANLGLRRREIQAAESLVEKAVLDYQSWLEGLKARPTMERFEGFLNDVLEKELALLLEESGATEEKKREVCERIRAKLMHPPLEKIKEASQNGGVGRYLEALHALFDLDKKS